MMSGAVTVPCRAVAALIIMAFATGVSAKSSSLVFSELTREDRAYFSCVEADGLKTCFDQYVAFTNQRIATSEPDIYIDNFRCAQFGQTSAADFAVSGRLVDKYSAARSALGTKTQTLVLKVRFYAHDADEQPVEMPRRGLTYFIPQRQAAAQSLQDDAQAGQVGRAIASYFTDCRQIAFVATELTPLEDSAVAVRRPRSRGNLQRQ
ncbi:MAG: hypothetical protein GWP70_12335 [Proteobacteria bacterium]|nr:hypothetical protein [Pseudomonadota bacterium]